MSAVSVIRTGAEASWVFLKLLYTNYREDRCPTTAAALTYQTLFAVVPLLTITYTVLESFEAFEGMGEMLGNFLFANVVPENVAMIEGYLSEFSDQAKSLSTTSLLVLAVTAFLMMFTMERSLNEIWRVQEPRHGFQRILMYWAVLTLGPPLIGGGLAITTYILSLPLLSDVTGYLGVLALVPILLNVVVFTLMYLTIPNCVVPLRHGLLGGVVVAVLFELVKQAFGGVMSQSDFQVIYGTYAAVPLFLIWIYVSWTLVLFGAELTKGLGLYHSERSRDTEAPMLQILLILETFFRCHMRGEVVTDKILSQLSHRVDMHYWHDHKAWLLKQGLIRQVDRGGLVLSKDLDEVTFWDIYRAAPWDLPEGFKKSADGWESLLNDRLRQLSASGKERLNLDLEKLFRGVEQ